jgi:DNA polymerase-3 subunit gamma/tau
LVRDLLQADSAEPRQARPAASPPAPAPRASMPTQPRAQAQSAPALETTPANAPTLRTLEDMAALAGTKGAAVLKVHIENDMHLVRLEPGQIEFRPGPRAPRTLSGDLAQKLKEWTGLRWVVTVAREGGAPTLSEAKKSVRAARIEAVAQEPLVRAVLDRFPGSEIVHVRDRAEPEIAEPAEESGEA